MMENSKKDIPIYPNSCQYAVAHKEVDQYVASFNAHEKCAGAVRAAINQNYDGFSLNTEKAMRQVLDEFGIDRTKYVLASAIQDKSWDGRISQANKQWAATVPIVDDIEPSGRRRNAASYMGDVHPGLVNLFANQLRKELTQERKPSIREQLAEKPVHGNKPPTKAKGRDERT